MSKELIGRVCIKLSGKEAGRTAVIVDKLNAHFVLIDGNVKRRKCNLLHLELTDKILKIDKKASTEDVEKAMKKDGLEITKSREKGKIKPKPKKKRETKGKPEEKPEEKKDTKKEEKKNENR